MIKLHINPMQTRQRLTRKHKLLTTPLAFLRGSGCDSWKQGCIRDADKWWDVVVMSRERCIAEAHRQLSDTDVHRQVSSNVFFDVIEEAKDIQSRLQMSGVITEVMATYAVPVISKSVRFYILPLIHKSGCPRIPIESAGGSPAKDLTGLVYRFIQPFVSNIPTCILDTQDFLDRLHAH